MTATKPSAEQTGATTETPVSVCTSIFKDGENSLSKEKYTQFWVEAINVMEKNKIAQYGHKR